MCAQVSDNKRRQMSKKKLVVKSRQEAAISAARVPSACAIGVGSATVVVPTAFLAATPPINTSPDETLDPYQMQCYVLIIIKYAYVMHSLCKIKILLGTKYQKTAFHLIGMHGFH